MTIERRKPVLLGREAAKAMVCLARPEPKAARSRVPAERRMERLDLAAVLGARTLATVGDGLLLKTGLDNPRPRKLDTVLPPLEIRLRIIYTVDDSGLVDGSPPPSRESLVPMYVALVETMRQDWAGTGIDFVFLPDCDFEILEDSRLNNDFTLEAADLAKFPAAKGDFTHAEISAMVDAGSNTEHRNKFAAERPNTLLWLVCEPNALVLDEKAGKWVYRPHVPGNWSGHDVDFVVLNKWDFAQSEQHNRDDASRAAHETGHFLHLWHTHRDKPALHDEPTEPALTKPPTAAARLKRWQKAIADYLDQNLPAGTKPAKALEFYDMDRDGGVDDTPADPGAGLIALANLAAGGTADALGPVASVSVKPANVTGAVTFDPDRANPMSYFLGTGTGAPMVFSPGQTEVMRDRLINGNRRRLVGAQLGDTAEPNVRICAVWSPNAQGQFFGTRADPAAHEARHLKWTAKKFHLASQCAYVKGGKVLYDGIWNQGARGQRVLWGWLDKHAEAEIAKRAKAGWRVVHVQAYRHPGTGLRYNVIFEKGSQKQVVKLGLSKAQLDQAWDDLMPAGNRLRHLDSAIDETGQLRFATVFEPGKQKQKFVADFALDDIAEEYAVEWAKARKFATLSVAWTPGGPRYSGIWNPDADGQLVMWLHVRERIFEVYNEMWCQGFKLRSLHTVTV